MYRKNGRQIHEKAGRHYQDDMTPARASWIRSKRIEGKQPTNKEKREAKSISKTVENPLWTVDNIWEAYKSRKPLTRSLRVDDNRYHNHLKSVFGSSVPGEIEALEINRFRVRLLKNLSPQTVRHVLALLRRIIQFGVKKGWCTPLPFQIEMPRPNNKVTEDLTMDQMTKLLQAIESADKTNIQAAAIMKMALFTGMRASQLFRLQWQDIHWDQGCISVRDSQGKPDQQIPLNAPTRDLLKNHPRNKKSAYVFPGKYGGQRKTASRGVNKIKNTAGLPKDFRPLQGLRHIYARMLAASGKVDMAVLQHLLTHKSPTLTQRYADDQDAAFKRASQLSSELIINYLNHISNSQ